MASLNKVLMIGRLTKDPELRFLPNGTPKAELRLATSRDFKDRNGERQKETCYVDVVVWSRQAEIAKQYLSKGRQVFVEGRLDFQEWEKDGQRRSKHQIIADRVQFLDRTGDEGGNGERSYGNGERSSYAGSGGGNGGGYGGGGGERSYGGNGGGNGGGYGGAGNGGGNGRSYGGKTYGGNYDEAGEYDRPPEPTEAPPMSEVIGIEESDVPF